MTDSQSFPAAFPKLYQLAFKINPEGFGSLFFSAEFDFYRGKCKDFTAVIKDIYPE